MVRAELQKLIDKANPSREEMRKIGESYLRGDVLRDPTAAEAWLMKVIDSGDNEDSMAAMYLLAREIWGEEIVVSKQDYEAMRKDFEGSEGEEREKMRRLIDSMERNQRDI